MIAATEQTHLLTTEHKYLCRTAVFQPTKLDESVESVYARQRKNHQDENSFKAHTQLIRFAIAFLLVLIIADLLPHPALSPGFISTSFFTVKQALQETIR